HHRRDRLRSRHRARITSRRQSLRSRNGRPEEARIFLSHIVKDTTQTIPLDQTVSDSERFEALKDFNVLGHASHHPVEILRFNTCGSVDEGKSTLIGRLLYDSKSLMEDEVEALQRSAAITGEGKINLADLTDGLGAELEQ